MDLQLPPTFDVQAYRAAWPDLAELSDEQAADHYATYGRQEGRQSNKIATRDNFVGLIPANALTLEIGPFCWPLLSGPNARFFDVLDQEHLRERAKQIGLPDARIPSIDYVSPTGDLEIVPDSFDYVLSSHCIEHQPNLVGHLRHVSRLLRPGGRYFLLVPDHRYVFDAFIAASTVAEVLDAHHANRKVHTLRSVIEHRALTTHNDPSLHWAGNHGALVDTVPRVMGAVQEWEAAAGGYVDVHAWYFTPESAEQLLTILRLAGYINLVVERVYPTCRGNNEFWMVLSKDDVPSLA